MKKLFVAAVIAASVLISYYHSDRVYRYYLATYYFKYKKETRDSLYKRAGVLYAEKKLTDLETHLNRMMVLFPEDREIRKTAAINLMLLGKTDRGVDLLMSVQDKTGVPDSALKDTVKNLYERGFYRDIIGVMKQRPSDDPDTLFYYGLSLYYEGDLRGSLGELKKSLDAGKTDYIAYLRIGDVLDALGDPSESLRYYKEAWTLKYRDPEVNRALVRAYRKLGRLDDAAKMLREQKRHGR